MGTSWARVHGGTKKGPMTLCCREGREGEVAAQEQAARAPRPPAVAAALKFVLMVGAMSLFADFTYEGSRSIVGPYLGALGAGALAIAVITGLGEFFG